MVEIGPGWFVMGSDTGPMASRPAHRVHLAGYRIGIREVTIGEFEAYVAESGNMPAVWSQAFARANPLLPMTGILWREAKAFCDWRGGRLPTEAEWEKAARGADGRTYPWGNAWDPARANTREGGEGAVVDVGSYAEGRSPYGALDMAGNAQEWVADYFHPDYYRGSPVHDPRGPLQVLDHGLRGGSWASSREVSTTFFRDSSHSVQPNPRVGFRCAEDLPP